MSFSMHISTRNNRERLNPFPLNPAFYTLKELSFGKHSGNMRNCLNRTISPFPTMFSTLYDSYFLIQTHLDMLSATSLNLDQSKIFLSCNRLMKNLHSSVKFIIGRVNIQPFSPIAA